MKKKCDPLLCQDALMPVYEVSDVKTDNIKEVMVLNYFLKPDGDDGESFM